MFSTKRCWALKKCYSLEARANKKWSGQLSWFNWKNPTIEFGAKAHSVSISIKSNPIDCCCLIYFIFFESHFVCALTLQWTTSDGSSVWLWIRDGNNSIDVAERQLTDRQAMTILIFVNDCWIGAFIVRTCNSSYAAKAFSLKHDLNIRIERKWSMSIFLFVFMVCLRLLTWWRYWHKSTLDDNFRSICLDASSIN